MSWQRDRDLGFEEQFAHHEEQAFKAAAHRNRLLALWAAEKMQLRHREAESYVEALVTGDVKHLRHADSVIEKVLDDLRNAGVKTTLVEVRSRFEQYDAEAKKEYGDT